jgi:hypothetical protein
MRSCCPECCAQISSCRFVLAVVTTTVVRLTCLQVIKRISARTNTVHLRRGAHLTFQPHYKAQYISVTRFVHYVGGQFITCKEVWLKTKCFASEFCKSYLTFILSIKQSFMVVSTVGLLMGQWLKIGIAVCGNNISNFKQKPWSCLYSTLGSLFIMPSRQSVWLGIETPGVICVWTNEMRFHKH